MLLGKKLSNSTSIYIGVCQRKYKTKTYWVARFADKRIHIYVGAYKTELEAALAYDKYVLGHNLSRPLNF
jgi:hypothetical protein